MKLKQCIFHALYATLHWHAVPTGRQFAMGLQPAVTGAGYFVPNRRCSLHRGSIARLGCFIIARGYEILIKE